MPPQIDPLLVCLDLIHALQNERGFAARYLCRHGDHNKIEMDSQFIVSDIVIEKIPESMLASGPALDSLGPIFQLLPSHRAKITEESVMIGDALAWYSENLIAPAIDFVADHILHDTRIVPVRASAFIYLLQWQERLSQEREMVTQLAGQEWLHDDAFIRRLKNIIRERQTFERLFWGVADDKQRQVCAPLKKIFTDGPSADIEKTGKSGDKFAFFGTKIEALHEAARKMALQLVDENALAVTAPTGQALDMDVEGHYDLIRALPLFRGLSNDVLRDLLRSARILQQEKNAVFINQGETSGRFYIILEGWVKLYASTAEGNESILQILGRRECVAESDMFPITPSTVSAKTITKTKFLSLSSSILRDFIAQHKDLALNLLLLLSRRMQRVVGHFEQLTLHSAKERVGRFLLNQLLDTGIGGPPIMLPFDKSLIAAYLGIKPETFSRILQNFRESGFVIDRQNIALPSPHALCGFCDYDTMQKCDLAGTPSCPREEKYGVKFAS